MKRRVLNTLAVSLLILGIPGALWLWSAFGRERGQSLVHAILSPPVRLVSGASRFVSNSLEFVVTSGQVREEIDLLRRESARLALENSVLREAISKYDRLDAAAKLAEIESWRVVEADVVAYGSRTWVRSLDVSRGSESGVQAQDPVIHMNGLAGIVKRANPYDAVIQLLTDPQTAIGVLVLPVRIHGMLRGTGSDDVLELTLEDPNAPIEPGQRIITSGMRNSLYPKGLYIGNVAGVGKNRFGESVGLVEPAVNFSRMEEVLILVTGLSGKPSVARGEPESSVVADFASPGLPTPADSGTTLTSSVDEATTGSHGEVGENAEVEIPPQSDNLEASPNNDSVQD